MTKAEIISQLKSLRDSTADFIRWDSDPIFKKDVEALDAAIDFLNQYGREVSPNDEGERKRAEKEEDTDEKA